MNWIETLFGLDPDFGSGSLELLIGGAVAFAVATLVLARMRTRGRARA